MKKISFILMLMCLAVVTAQAVLIDDFEDGDLSDYTYTVILDVDGNPHNDAVWQITNGQLQLATTAYHDIEQAAFIKNGYTLNVGRELQVDFTHNGGNRAMGLYVGVVPTENVRQNYISVYAQSTTSVLSRGFNGTDEMSLLSANGDYDKLFIARDGPNDYEAGFYIGDVRIVIADRNGLQFGDGDTLAVGFYTDVRDDGVLGDADNLTIIDLPLPPTILSDPNNVTTTLSQDVMFKTVFTSPTAPWVSWYKITSPDNIWMDPDQSNIDVETTYDAQSDEYTSTLTLTNVTTSDSGLYYCQITNAAGTRDSQTANLLVYGLVAHWTLDQSRYSGGYYLEEVAGYDAAVTGSPAFVAGVDGAANGAAVISATDGWALCPMFNPVQQSGQMSISFWANWGQPLGTEADLSAESTNNKILTMPNGLTADGQWQHICTVFDGTNGTLYVDGVLRDQNNWQLPADTEAVINIGINRDSLNPFNGAMDDVRLYNYALTAYEVADLRYGLSGQGSCIPGYADQFDISGPAGQPDCAVDLWDLITLAEDFLQAGSPYDTTGPAGTADGFVNMYEFEDLASSWMSCGLYPGCD